eukprot:7456441-Heterocapsa_arctica.AAC.1
MNLEAAGKARKDQGDCPEADFAVVTSALRAEATIFVPGVPPRGWARTEVGTPTARWPLSTSLPRCGLQRSRSG